jgi:hypothetical protein
MREFCIVFSLFFVVGGYMLHFIPGSVQFWGGDYALPFFYAGIALSILGILMYRFDTFLTIAAAAGIGGYVLIFHLNYL